MALNMLTIRNMLRAFSFPRLTLQNKSFNDIKSLLALVMALPLWNASWISTMTMKLTVELRAKPEKTQELYQTLQALLPSIRKEKGCRGCRVWRDVEDEEDILPGR